MWQPKTKEAVLREVRIRQWRAHVWQRSKEVALSCVRWLVACLKKVVRQLQIWSATKAQELEVSRCLSQRYDKLLRLGEQVYAVYRSGNLSWETIVPLCEELERQDKELELLRQRSLVVVTDDLRPASSATGS